METNSKELTLCDNDPADPSVEHSKLSRLPELMPSEEFSRTQQARLSREDSNFLTKLVSRIVRRNEALLKKLQISTWPTPNVPHAKPFGATRHSFNSMVTLIGCNRRMWYQIELWSVFGTIFALHAFILVQL